MATVRYGQRQVATAPLPGVRKQAAETPDSLGAGIARAQEQRDSAVAAFGGQVSQLTGSAAIQMARQAKKEADDYTVLEAKNRYTEGTNHWQYTGDTAAYNRRGKDARGLEDEFQTYHDKLVSQVGTLLKNRDQQDAFSQWVAGAHAGIKESLQRWTLQQDGVYRESEVKAGRKNAVESAVGQANNPPGVAKALGEAELMLINDGKYKGFASDSDYTKAEIASLRNEVHTGVINQLLAEGQDGKAQDYFNDHVSQITDPDAKKSLVTNLELGAVRGQAQDESEKIIAQEKDPVERVKLAKKVGDNTAQGRRLRDAVQERVEHQNALDKQTEQVNEQKAMGDAQLALLNSRGDMSSIPTPTMALLKEHIPQLLSFADAARDHFSNRKTDQAEWYRLETLMGRDPEKFASLDTNLWESRLKLSEPDWQRFVAQQTELRKILADKSKKADVIAATIDDQMFHTLAAEAGLPVYDTATPEFKERIEKLRYRVEQEIDDRQAVKKGPLDRKEKEDAMRSVLNQKVARHNGVMFGLFDAQDVVRASTVLSSESGNVFIPTNGIPKKNYDAFVNVLTTYSPAALRLSQEGKLVEVKARWKDAIERAAAWQVMGRSEQDIVRTLLGDEYDRRLIR